MKEKASSNFWSLEHIFATFLDHLINKAKNSILKRNTKTREN